MGHVFSLVLSREISDDETTALRGAGCGEAAFSTDTLPTNAEVTVARLDFDDTTSPSLAEAIESALEAVKKVPDLSVPGLTVPAVPKKPDAEPDVVDGEVVESAPDEQAAEVPAAESPVAAEMSAAG